MGKNQSNTPYQKGKDEGRPEPIYRTKYGKSYCGIAEDLLLKHPLTRYKKKVQLLFTSPPFPLNSKKRYGNLHGEAYIEWLSSFADLFCSYIRDNGSIVIELGNAWEPGKPIMSTLTLKALLAFQEKTNLYLCQEFICYNPARLPTPAQWVNVDRIRVKDAFTRLWWLSPTCRPKADNRRVLKEYSSSMKKLLINKKYNAGRRPSEHNIGKESFFTDNGGAIPPNVLTISNTQSTDIYQQYCRTNGFELHPARMPIDLPQFFIKFLTEEKDLVLDPFAGSNTTGAAAEILKRRWLSIEANLDYAESAVGRFTKVHNVS